MDSPTSATTAAPCEPTTSATHTISQSHVAVAEGFYWTPVGPDTPRGVKLQLLTKGGVAIYGDYVEKMNFYTHWAPLPRRRKADAETETT